MKKFLVWLYIILLIITTAVVIYCLNTKIKDSEASSMYWYIGGVAFAVWLVMLILLVFAIKSKSGYMTVEIPIGLKPKLTQDVKIYNKSYNEFKKAQYEQPAEVNPEYAAFLEHINKQK